MSHGKVVSFRAFCSRWLRPREMEISSRLGRRIFHPVDLLYFFSSSLLHLLLAFFSLFFFIMFCCFGVFAGSFTLRNKAAV